MKIYCSCGFMIHDGTDDLPQKGHLIPDQDWNATYDAVEGIIDEVADGRSSRELAYQHARQNLFRSARTTWQCRMCGRLYVNDLDNQLRCFRPDGEPIEREILRSRPS